MNSGKAENFERHRKEIRKKAFLNASIVLLFATGLGFYVGGYTADFLRLLFSSGTAVFLSTIFVGAIVAIWSLPLLHYREEDIFLSQKGKEFYREREMGKLPLVQILEEKGWDVIESDEEKVTLKTYQTALHKLLNREIHLTLETVKEEDEEDIAVMKKDDKEMAKIKTEYKEKDEGLEIHETTVSRSRVSPLYLEIVMFLAPELEDLSEEAAEEDIEALNEDVDVGLKPYEFN